MIAGLLGVQGCRTSPVLRLTPDPPRAGDTLQLQTRSPLVVAVEVHLQGGGRQVIWIDVDSLGRYLVPESAVVLRIHAFPTKEKDPEIFLTRVLRPSPEAELWQARFQWGDPELSPPGKADTAQVRRILRKHADHPFARVWLQEMVALEKDRFPLPDSLTARFSSRQEAYAWYVTLRARRKRIPGVYDTLQALARTFFTSPDWPDLPEMIRWGAYAFSRARDQTLWLEATRDFWEGRPGEGPLWALLARGRREQGDTAGALEAYARAWAVMPSPDLLQAWLDMVADSAGLARMLRRMDTLQSLPPVWRDPRLAFRTASDHRRWWNESMAELELSLSKRLEAMGDRSRALAYARQAYARPGEYPPRGDRAWFLGKVLWDTGDTSRAESLWLEALTHNPALDSARRRLLDLYRSRDPSGDAEETLRARLLQRMGPRDTLVDLTLQDLETAETLHLRDVRGKTVVINFWATWCGPCRHEIPLLNRLVERYQDDTSVVFLGITDERPSVVRRFLKTHPFAYRVLLAAAYRSAYRITGIPTHLVVDPSGRVIFRHVGSEPAIHERLDREIRWVQRLTRSRETALHPPGSPHR